MRGLLIALWLLVPAGTLAYHYGPGQTRLRLDDTASLLSQARVHVRADEHAEAAALFDEALAKLPSEREGEGHRIRVERAKSQLLSGQLPAAYDDLAVLVPLLQEDSETNPALLADARETQANAKYYLTWLMRLEGEPRSEWEPEIEASRQTYRLLAEQATDRHDDAATQRHRENLEAAIRLARLDLSELQALPLPSQCKGCCSGECQCRGKGMGKGRGKSQNKQQGDEFARGASSGPPPDDGGN
jgi:hypothetical protein